MGHHLPHSARLSSSHERRIEYLLNNTKFRSQTLNVADALEKLRMCIRSALEPPKPKFTDEEKEKIRKGKLKAARERLHFKRIRSDVNAGRKEKQVV